LKKDHIKIFGNVVMVSAYCPECQDEALIAQGEYTCCGASYEEKKLDKIVRESEPVNKRKILGRKSREEILAQQNFCCFYCDRRFGKTVYRKGKPIALKINYDHQVPFAYGQNNSADNFVAACHICNAIKSSMLFDSIDKARLHILAAWAEKGITDEK